MTKRTILVTGSPRSGTTWIGRILATAPKSAYVLEPMNRTRAEYFGLPVSHWYQRIDADSEAEFARGFQPLLAGRAIGLGDPLGLSALRSPLATLREMASRAGRRMAARRAKQVIVKDPIAILSADWLARRFSATVVVTIRHPAAVVSSLRLQGWSPDFDDLFHQREVIEAFFPDIQEWLAQHPLRPGQDETLYKGAILWRLLHEVIRQYRRRFPGWAYIRHEDVSRAPHQQIRQLFNQLQLPFTTRTERFIEQTTQSSTYHAQQAIPTNVVVRDTARHVDVWRDRLTPEEVDQIRELTAGVADDFYGADDWL